MADVLLDLWGVLTDSRKMSPAFRRKIADLLASRHGGSVDAWLRAHDAANEWYSQHMAKPETWSHRTWRGVVHAADRELILRMFGEVGAPPPLDPHGLSQALELELMGQIDAAFPDARPAVRRLKSMGHQVYVSTNATESNARGALAGARLLQEIHGLFTGELLDAGKQGRDYWTAIAERLRIEPRSCLVVDDRNDYLKGAASVGFRCLLLDRTGAHPLEAMPAFVDATLRNLAGLPPWVETWTSEGRS